MSHITDEAAECVKVIVDNNRCGTCDNIGGNRVRHQCGHYYCDDCVAKVEHCLLCLTPPDTTLPTPRTDNPASRRASNAATLLKTFQEAFVVDVYKRSRISEQLKLERDIFPDCIQAPVKYHNKRKSLLSLSKKYSTGPSFLPGESVSPLKSIKMENSLNYVHKWLDNNQMKLSERSPRKPFSDLNVNSPTALRRGKARRPDFILDKSKKDSEDVPRKKRKSSFKSSLALVESQALLDTYLKPVKKGKEFQNIRRDFDDSESTITKMIKEIDKDESGIVLDEEPIVIDDSQSQLIDKDRLALLAVLQEDARSPYVSQTLELNSSEVSKNINTTEFLITEKNRQSLTTNKVPFYKRSYLTETCFLCKKTNCIKPSLEKLVVRKPKDVSITIESNSFTTTIKMSTCQHKPVSKRHSIPIQTDPCYLDISKNVCIIPQSQVEDDVNHNIDDPSANHGKELPSQDIFTDEMEDHKKRMFPKVGNKVIISDTDSDDAANESSILQVTAEVHQSIEQLKPDVVLSELEPNEVQQRGKRCRRGVTPNSSDSSDKENFDPNKAKRAKHGKKESKKRKLTLCNKK